MAEVEVYSKAGADALFLTKAELTNVSNVLAINNGANRNTPRPATAELVIWRGSAVPKYAKQGDLRDDGSIIQVLRSTGWVTVGGGSSSGNATPISGVIPAAAWNSVGQAEVSLGSLLTGAIQVYPYSQEDAALWGLHGVWAAALGVGTIQFTCVDKPTEDIKFAGFAWTPQAAVVTLTIDTSGNGTYPVPGLGARNAFVSPKNYASTLAWQETGAWFEVSSDTPDAIDATFDSPQPGSMQVEVVIV